ncbi:MAG: glycosyltransferase family 2 protein [Candidatus Lokiarchaeota archaeon]|nr:glycosyltransferase family 2 protein [Candidatus Lokiarchaeota archaeon]
MKKIIYDLVVAYRIYPKISKSTPVFQNNKFKLAHLCLKSFKESLGSLNIKIYVLLDNCPPEYEELFYRYFKKENLEIIRLNGIGNQRTFKLQLDLLLKQNYSEIVYFAEDDYFYFPNQFEIMLNFLKKNIDVDFVTPYDHLDYYVLPLHDYKSIFKNYSTKQWKKVSSTTCTFLTSKTALNKTKKVFKKYSYVKNFFDSEIFKQNRILNCIFSEFMISASDTDIWLSLTKINAFKLLKLIRYRIQNREAFGFYFRAWRFHWNQILFGKKWNLYCPKPTIATHMESICLSPNINWEEIFKKASLEIE